MTNIVNNIFQSIILQPLILIMYYLGKVMNSILNLNFATLFSSKGLSSFLLVFMSILIIIMISIYLVGILRSRFSNTNNNDMSKREITKRFSFGLLGLMLTPLILIGIFGIAAILKVFASLVGFKEINFIQSLFSFSKTKDIEGLVKLCEGIDGINISSGLNNKAFNNIPLLINNAIKDKESGIILKEIGNLNDSFRYVEINQNVIDLMLKSKWLGLEYIQYDYILLPIFMGIAIIFILLPLMVSIISRLFNILINYILLYSTLAMNILKPQSTTKSIQKIFADIIILSTYGVLFFIVQLIQNTIINMIVNSNMISKIGWLGLNIFITMIIFTGITISSLWPTYLVSTLFGDDQLVQQINNSNQSLWRRSSGAFRTSGIILTQAVASFSHLFKGTGKSNKNG